MKQIKLFLINYDFTVQKYGENQKAFHRLCFDKLLCSYLSGFVPLSINVSDGELLFVEATDTENHLVFKYFFKSNSKAV